MLVIVPNSLRNAIMEKLDAAIRQCPDAEKDRDVLYHQLLDYFNEHRVIPEFSVKKKVA